MTTDELTACSADSAGWAGGRAGLPPAPAGSHPAGGWRPAPWWSRTPG
jgi:hypothetical protein